MAGDVVVVFTGEPLQQMIREGRSGHWKASKHRLSGCDWIVAARNRHTDWGARDIEHGSAFLIGRISAIRDSETRPGRHVVEFDRYAEIDLKEAWPGNQNPVTYLTFEDLKVKTGGLKWKMCR